MDKVIHSAKVKYCQFLNLVDSLVASNVAERMLLNLPDRSILIGHMLKKLNSGKIIRDKGTRNKKRKRFAKFYSKNISNHKIITSEYLSLGFEHV